MNERQEKQIIQRAFDLSLSGLREDPFLARRILHGAHEKGKEKVKKKLSVGLILLLVILMASVAALAWSLSQQYFEDVAQLQFESGYYDDWGWKEKRAMVGILQEHGLITEKEAAAMKTEAAVDAYMIDRYGIDGRSDTIGLWAILEKEMGPISVWTMEEKVWYTEMRIEIGLLTRENDDFICAMPEKTDVQPEEAIAIARTAILSAYQLNQDALEHHLVDIAFETHASDWERENLHYNINFWGEGLGYYSCSVTRDGRIMDSSMGEFYRSPAEQVQDDIRFANENDREAIAVFSEYHLERLPEGYSEFAFWPLENKQEITDLLRPVILENMAENPDYADYTRIFWATHIYGMPDEKSISPEKAVELAQMQLTETLGLTDAQAELVDRAGLFYEITDPEHPLWKITMRIGDRWEDAMALGMKMFQRFRVVLDAYSGEILETHVVEEYENSPEYAAMTN